MKKWKMVDVDFKTLQSQEFENLVSIEELTDYEIIKDNNKSTRLQKRKKKNDSKKPKKKPKQLEIEWKGCDPKVEDVDMSAWFLDCFIPDPILQSLKELNFLTPTPIQKLCIPAAVRDHKDILGAAETGSGKTLAYAIPVVTHILFEKEKNIKDSSPLYSLILAPTRELCLQIKIHIQAICRHTKIMIATVIGGMASEKQKRILKKCPDIVIATPGRLWELIEEGEPHLNKLPFVKHLVIDEADRMLEKGHFTELAKILDLMNNNKSKKRQNLVFSATLTLVHETPKRLTFKKNKQSMHKKLKLDSLISAIGMEEKPKIFDITKKTAVVETLTESQIICSIEEKDTYLYYFVTMNPGRTIVFCNSIDCVRRLRTIFEYLNCNPLPLHASMHQKQRFKNLEKFANSENALLLCTDVAARGLDIRNIQHVIHYQVPRTAETYVHRSGRTARAQNEGLSLMLIEPQEGIFYKRICRTLNKDKSLPTFPVDYSVLKIVKERVSLACVIDKMEHRMKRMEAQNRWLLNAAKETEIDIEDENLLNDLGSQQEYASKSREIKILKKRLQTILSKPIMPRWLGGSYPTKTGKLISPVVSSAKWNTLKKILA